MNKEIEEAAEKLYPVIMLLADNTVVPYDHNEEQRDAFIEGAKWQAERMFTKNEMFFFAGYLKGARECDPYADPSKIFEDFLKLKKK